MTGLSNCLASSKARFIISVNVCFNAVIIGNPSKTEKSLILRYTSEERGVNSTWAKKWYNRNNDYYPYYITTLATLKSKALAEEISQ
jgi:hypothetical protein